MPRTVSELMTRRVIAVGPDTSCKTASRMMIEHRITGAPVIDQDGYPVGVISLTDLVDPDRPTREIFGFDNYYLLENGEIRALGSGQRVDGGRVKELMTAAVVRISALALVRDAALMMTQRHIHRLLVIDGARLLGILSALDLARDLLEPAEELSISAAGPNQPASGRRTALSDTTAR